MSDYGYRLAKKAADIDKFFNDLSTLTDPQSAIYNLGAGVRPNLLDNPYFVGGGSQQGYGYLPINQRGQTSYTGSFSADEWFTGGTCSLAIDGIELTAVGASDYITWLGQYFTKSKIEGLLGKVITLSAIISNTAGTWRVQVANDTRQEYSFESANAIVGTNAALLVLTGTFPPQWSADDIVRTAIYGVGETVSAKLISVKLEEGPVQTHAYLDAEGQLHRLPQPEDYFAVQLEKCQAYQLNVDQTNYPATYIGPNVMEFFIPTPATMRINPSVAVAPEIRTANEVFTDFAISYYKAENGVKVMAVKEAHGITNGYLSFLPGALLDANLLFS